MTRLIIVSGEQAGQPWDLPPGTHVVGRQQDCEVILTDASVSGRHCSLCANEFGVTLRDLGSTNGTYVEDQKIGQMELRDGQILRVGAVQLRIEIPSVAITIPELSHPEPPAPRFLEDGSPACANHPESAATWRCVVCKATFCPACLHDVHLRGQPSQLFCPACSGHCEQIPETAPAPATSFTTRILKALPLPFGRRKE